MISASADVERHGCKDGGFWILHTPPFLSGALKILSDFQVHIYTNTFFFVQKSVLL